MFGGGAVRRHGGAPFSRCAGMRKAPAWGLGRERGTVGVVIVLVVGDSHAQYFRTSEQVISLVPALADVTAYVKVTHGATLTGVGKMNSTLDLAAQTQRWIANAKPAHVVFNLGQVDVELGLPYRRFVKGNPASDGGLMDEFVGSYARFTDSLDYEHARISFKGINLPVLVHDRTKAIKYVSRIVTERFNGSAEDDALKDAVLTDLQASYPGDEERTALAHEFNRRLRVAAAELGVSYFDINDDILDPATGMVASRFIPFGFDHHLMPSLEVHAMHWRKLLPLVLSDRSMAIDA